MVKKNLIFVLGHPGSGKGTQCQKITDNTNNDFHHFSAGALLRQEREHAEASRKATIEQCIMTGKVVPAEITVGLLEKAIFASDKSKFLIDGFPMNVENRTRWDKKMGGKVRLLFVLFIDCPSDICADRCIKRSDNTERYDDTVYILEKRFETFENETRPVLDWYRKRKFLKTVDGSRNPDAVYEDIKQLINDIS